MSKNSNLYTSRRFHIIIDAFGCEVGKLQDKNAITSLVKQLATLVDMKILEGPVVVDGIPENPGITAFAIIDFSHISIHTFTKSKEFCLDVFSCKFFESKKVSEFVKSYFGLMDKNIYSSVVRYDQIPVNRAFDTYSAKKYLAEYYQKLSRENKDILKWYNEIYTDLENKNNRLLEVGGGPTIYQLVSASSKVQSITFTDYSEKNLEEIKSWKNGQLSSFNWDRFIKFVLGLENQSQNKSDIDERKELLRAKMTNIESLDLNNLKDEFANSFDIVQSNFCAESATDDITEYKNMLSKIYAYLKPDGLLLMTALEGAIAYKSGDDYFPAIYLDEEFAQQYLEEAGFEILSIQKKNSENPSESKYHGLLFIKAVKK